MKKYIVYCLMLSSLLLVGCSETTRTKEKSSSSKVQISSKSLELETFKGVDQILEGRYTFLMFGSDTCPHCIKQKKDFLIEKYNQRYNKMSFYYVNSKSKIYKEMSRNKIFKHDSYPTSFIVEKERGKLNVFDKFEGYTSPEVFHTYFEMISED